jgi:hypothetical protein
MVVDVEEVEEATARESRNRLLAHRVLGWVVRILMHLEVGEWDMGVPEGMLDMALVGNKVEV